MFRQILFVWQERKGRRRRLPLVTEAKVLTLNTPTSRAALNAAGVSV